MNVSDLAREVGIAPSAVRFYERRGVLPTAARRENGYREYSADDLCRLRIVVSLRMLGLELAAAGRLADLCQTGHCDEMSRDLAPLVAAQRAAVERSRAELDALDRQLATVEASLAVGEPTPDTCLAKGGEIDDQLRLRAVLPVPADGQLRVLNSGC
ncbi:MAG TPA: MerR family transcriptional regulator [Candidatus Limnocylindrales bacterium]|jgi:DNA-binding transcriptional MerR regulator